jgi:hypothetical protein
VKRNILILLLVTLLTAPVFAEENLSKKSQNPVGDIISLPIEYWHYDGIANDSSVDALVMKPVYPVRIGNANLINRLIIPYMGVRSLRPLADPSGLRQVLRLHRR